MKTKRVVVGAVAAAMLSLSVCSLAPVMAADETVQISVGTVTAAPGAEFTVDVSIADIPAAGIQGCQFSVEYDSSLITVESVTAGALTETGADSVDGSASLVSLFDSTIHTDEGIVDLMWSTIAESTYWLQGSGVFCTISGTVAADAADGTTAELKVVATDYVADTAAGTVNTEIKAGYVGTDSVAVNYDSKTTDGAVNISSGAVTETLKGDANCNNEVEVADAVYILQGIADPSNEAFKLTEQGKSNADIDGNGVDGEDALKIQQFMAGIISTL